MGDTLKKLEPLPFPPNGFQGAYRPC